MNVEVTNRLIHNLQEDKLRHYQGSWLEGTNNVFVISPEKRWTCATSGCAAGFLFLSEAPEGAVFDVNLEMVFDNNEQYQSYLNEDLDDYEAENLWSDHHITSWAGDVLGIPSWQANELFYNTDADTREIIEQLQDMLERSTVQE
jgi:hypothetical protein